MNPDELLIAVERITCLKPAELINNPDIINVPHFKLSVSM